MYLCQRNKNQIQNIHSEEKLQCSPKVKRISQASLCKASVHFRWPLSDRQWPQVYQAGFVMFLCKCITDNETARRLNDEGMFGSLFTRLPKAGKLCTCNLQATKDHLLAPCWTWCSALPFIMCLHRGTVVIPLANTYIQLSGTAVLQLYTVSSCMCGTTFCTCLSRALCVESVPSVGHDAGIRMLVRLNCMIYTSLHT